jgi:glycosyltransferase involved in cell wall biosynthesis
VPPADSNSLASAILELIGNEQLRLSMGKAGRRRVAERFTLGRMVADTESVYTDLLAEGVVDRRR